MARRSKLPESPQDLHRTEAALLAYCNGQRADMVYLIDFTTRLAGLPKTLQGDWFDAKLLSPTQKAAHDEVVRDTRKALRRLFSAGLIDVGREDDCPEGFKRRHGEIIAALQKDVRWETGETAGLEAQVRHHRTWAEAHDLAAVTRQMGDKPQLVGLTGKGRDLATQIVVQEGEVQE